VYDVTIEKNLAGTSAASQPNIVEMNLSSNTKDTM